MYLYHCTTISYSNPFPRQSQGTSITSGAAYLDNGSQGLVPSFVEKLHSPEAVHGLDKADVVHVLDEALEGQVLAVGECLDGALFQVGTDLSWWAEREREM